jgi:signal transduction histidine kinase
VVSPGARRLAHFLLPPPPGGLGDVAQAGQAALLANVQVAVDLLLLAVLLHFSGGIENPFLYFFIFHVIIASLLFSRQATYVHALWGVALVSAVAVNESAGLLRHFPLGGTWAAGAYADPALVAAQLLVFATTLFLSAYMGSSIADRLRRREGEVVVLSLEVSRKAAGLAAALDRVSHAERAKSQYMRKVAHELRGPLGTIRTTMSALSAGAAGDLPERARELLQRVALRAGDLAQVTADLLALSRAREGRLAIEQAPVALAPLVADVVADARGSCDRAGVALDLQVSGEVGTIAGDMVALRELVGNLVSNAIRYTPRNGRVEVRLEQRGGSIVLEVEDSGIGIPEDELPRIFEEFYRCDNARHHSAEGTGLGLAIVRAAAEQHGGHVAARSSVGRGTCFTVTLPVVADQKRPTAIPAPV